VSLRWLPNAICVARMLLVLPVATTLLAGAYSATLALFAVAAVSDGLDGWLAKRYDWTSALGKLLDPIADKVLLVSLFLTLGWIGLMPSWLAAAVVLRDVVIVSGAITYRLMIGPVEGRPTIASKLNTLLQLSLVLAVIARAGWPAVPRPLLTVLGAATFVTTTASGIDYVLTWGRLAWRERRAARPA
jgi:cardiolipin synthase (CMP-forming)